MKKLKNLKGSLAIAIVFMIGMVLFIVHGCATPQVVETTVDEEIRYPQETPVVRSTSYRGQTIEFLVPGYHEGFDITGCNQYEPKQYNDRVVLLAWQLPNFGYVYTLAIVLNPGELWEPRCFVENTGRLTCWKYEYGDLVKSTEQECDELVDYYGEDKLL